MAPTRRHAYTDMRKSLHISLILLLLGTIGLLVGCQSDNAWNEMPRPIAKFVSQYFPGLGVSSFDDDGQSYHVKMNAGPGLTFDIDYQWIAINGYGRQLPEVLLFDQLPPPLYQYLQEGQNTSSVMSMERNARVYTVVLMTTTITYNIQTGDITQDATESPKVTDWREISVGAV